MDAETIRRAERIAVAKVLHNLTNAVWDRKAEHRRLMTAEHPRNGEWDEDGWFLDLLARAEQRMTD